VDILKWDACRGKFLPLLAVCGFVISGRTYVMFDVINSIHQIVFGFVIIPRSATACHRLAPSEEDEKAKEKVFG
jgi:hypothetical protein